MKKVHKDKAGPTSSQKNKNIQEHPDTAHLKTQPSDATKERT